MQAVSSNPGITSRDIYKKILKFDINGLSANPNLPIDYVMSNLELPWNSYEISKQASLTDIESYHNFTWCAKGLSENKNVTMNYVDSRPDIQWDSTLLCQHVSNISHPLFDNSHISYMSSNPNISFEWVQKNERYIDFNRLSYNSFNN
jgi:hypothetical protein